VNVKIGVISQIVSSLLVQPFIFFVGIDCYSCQFSESFTCAVSRTILLSMYKINSYLHAHRLVYFFGAVNVIS
jgi:hypothetical protein